MIWHKKKNIKRSFINVDDDDDDDAELFLIIRDEHTKQKKKYTERIKEIKSWHEQTKRFLFKKAMITIIIMNITNWSSLIKWMNKDKQKEEKEEMRNKKEEVF